MKMKYSYPTTMYESILAQMYVFLVFLHFTAFYHEKDFIILFTILLVQFGLPSGHLLGNSCLLG